MSPSGTLWVLANAGPELSAISYSSDGQAKGKVELDLSLGEFNITDFAALENDVLFLAGLTVGNSGGRSFAALLDGDSGKRIRIMRDTFPPEDATKKSTPIHRGGISAGNDGNVYLLHNTEILAINPAGEIVRRTSFEKPDANLLPVHLMVSSGYAAVWLRTPPRADRHFETTYLVVDTYNANPATWYAPPPEVRMPAASFSRNGGFQFLQSEKGHYKLITAELR